MNSVYRVNLVNLIETTDESYTNIENLVTRDDVGLRCVSFLTERGIAVELTDEGVTLAIRCEEAAFEQIHTALMCFCASVAYLLEAELRVIKARMQAAS